MYICWMTWDDTTMITKCLSETDSRRRVRRPQSWLWACTHATVDYDMNRPRINAKGLSQHSIYCFTSFHLRFQQIQSVCNPHKANSVKQCYGYSFQAQVNRSGCVTKYIWCKTQVLWLASAFLSQRGKRTGMAPPMTTDPCTIKVQNDGRY